MIEILIKEFLEITKSHYEHHDVYQKLKFMVQSNDFSYLDLVELYNQTAKKHGRTINIRGDVSSKKNFEARKKEKYTKVDFENAIDIMHLDQWHIDSEYKWGTLEYITRAKIMAKYINYLPVKIDGKKAILEELSLLTNRKDNWACERIIELNNKLNEIN